MEKNNDVIIIGAGPAGMTAAIYLKRAGINPLIIEKEAPGGTLNKTTKIENYPGYIDKEGTTLAFRMYSQIEELKISLKMESVLNIEKQEDLYKVITNKSEYYSKYILIASGKTPRKLDAKDADKFDGKGISYCAICDGALYKAKDVAVIGGGNSAMEATNYMAGIANKVYVINRSSSLRADKKEQEDALNNSNVEVIMNSKVVEVVSKENELSGLKLDNEKEINVNAIFVCIGQDTNVAYYQNLGLKTDNRGIVVDNDMKTSENHVFATGDAISKDLYQVVTATSEGAIAATNIIKEIRCCYDI